jgi:AAA+ superfamily predicted ATPase
MMAEATWEAANAAYLGASLHWLRLRLSQLVQPADAAAELALEQAAAARTAAAQVSPPPALVLLGAELGLSEFERDVLLLCVALELDTRVPELCAAASGDVHARHASFALALSALPGASWDALSAQRPLRYFRLLDVQLERASTLTLAPLRADERIVNYIKGLNVLDERISMLLRPQLAAQPVQLAASQLRASERIVAHWLRTASDGVRPVAVLLGAHTEAKLAVAQASAASLGKRLCVLQANALPAQLAEQQQLARLWQRESALLPLALYIDTQTEDPTAGSLSQFLSHAAYADSCTLVAAREPLAALGCAFFQLDIERPTAGEQVSAWSSGLSQVAGSSERDSAALAARLSGQFSFDLSAISELLRFTSPEPAATLGDRLWEACRERNRPRLARLCQRIDAKATWDDLVVAEDTGRALRELVAQVTERNTVYNTWGFGARMNRGFGISALFAGDSGTGKTMAAEVIANALTLTLYRVDLAQVVSKFIGETEKNLQSVFDAAESGGMVLFFDEADALFGKRSEVRDSHDRYANIEVNYLLQRMENHSGVAILATNMRSALDSAFVRRLRFIVPFNLPRPSERRSMWSKAFPPAVPVEDLELDRLAKLSLSGASIQNAALHAAFLAAQAGSAVTMPLLLRAVRSELQKIDRPINEAELRS